MRDVGVPRTLNIETSDHYTIDLPEINAILTINFYDLAGANANTEYMNNFAPRSNMIVICYSIESLNSFH